MEWLVANCAAQQLVDGAGVRHAVDALGKARMSPLMADFFCDLAKESAEPWAQDVLGRIGGDLGAFAKDNALLVLQRLGKEATLTVQLSGKDLRGSNLSNQRLVGRRSRGR